MDDREAALRTELDAAIKQRTQADAAANEAKARLDRGAALQAQVDAEFAALEAAQKEFAAKCENDHAFAILATVEHAGGADDVSLDIPTVDTAALITARVKARACETAMAKLAEDHANARDKAIRAAQACHVIADAIVDITIERAADAAVAAQEAAWEKLDVLRGACQIDARRIKPRTEALQQRVARSIDRFKHTVDATKTFMDGKDWADFQAAKAKAHEPAWLGFAARLESDADATFEQKGSKP